ncbi:MAG: hypothetical protein WCF26_01275 [Candidatus Sulfotelmatobacter sp.]
MLARLSKFVLVGVVAFSAVVVVTAARIAWLARLARSQGVTGPMAVDIALVTHSPLYWLLIAVILALAGWACHRWVFTG